MFFYTVESLQGVYSRLLYAQLSAQLLTADLFRPSSPLPSSPHHSHENIRRSIPRLGAFPPSAAEACKTIAGNVAQLSADGFPFHSSQIVRFPPTERNPMIRYLVQWATNPQYDECGDVDLDRLTENVKTFKQLAKAIAFARSIQSLDFFGSPVVYRLERKLVDGQFCWQSDGYPIEWDT